MARIEASRRFDLSVERGFAFITNTAHWSAYWPGFVRLQEGSHWGSPGDVSRLVTRFVGRERVLTMTIKVFEPNRLVIYSSEQDGLPDALHERHFTPDGTGFVYRLAIEYRPRGGIAGALDRLVLPWAIRRAFQRTFTALVRELIPSDPNETTT